MKKTILVTSLAAAMGVATTANAAFTAMGAGDYTMSITGGCFEFGNCQMTGTGAFTDNTAGEAAFTVTPLTITTRAVGSTVGSGTVGGSNGTINFSIDAAGSMTVTSYAQDSYLGTAGGTFYVDALGTVGTSAMTGNIDGAGSLLLRPTGREGLAANFNSTIGTQPWNDSKKIGMYDAFTTGTSTNAKKGASLPFTLTGTPLQDTGVNSWDGIIVSTGNINGGNWTGFANVQFSEVFNIAVSLVTGLPNAVDDNTLITPLMTGLSINFVSDLFANDTHADQTVNPSTAFTINSFTQPADPASTVANNGDGTFTYTPNPAFIDPSVDSFTYTVDDGTGALSTATVNITITSTLPPVANADTVATLEDTPLMLDPVHNTLAVAGVVLDSDPITNEIPNLSISTFMGFSTNNGIISQAAGTNVLTYTPAANFSGPDTFNYTIVNSIPLLASATITVNVTAVNDAPVCTDVGFTAKTDKELTINIANDLLSTTKPTLAPLCTDEEGDAVSLSTFDVTGSAGGILTSDGAGTLIYTPAANFSGEETFSFTATDGIDLSIPNTITFTVANLASNFTMLEKAGNVFGGTNDVVIEWDEASFNLNDDNGSGVPTDTNFGLITIASGEKFFGFNWTAHHVRIFKNTTTGPITFQFDVTCTAADYDSGMVDCNRPLGEQGASQQYLAMTLQPGEVGGHILFDWNTSKNIDVVNYWRENAVWADADGQSGLSNSVEGSTVSNDLWLGEAGITPSAEASWRLVSSDVAGDGKDGTNGSPMIDGAFVGFYANFNYKPDTALGDVEVKKFDENIDGVEADIFSMGFWTLLAGLLSLFGLRRVSNK